MLVLFHDFWHVSVKSGANQRLVGCLDIDLSLIHLDGRHLELVTREAYGALSQVLGLILEWWLGLCRVVFHFNDLVQE